MAKPIEVVKCWSVRALLWANSKVIDGQLVQIFSVTLKKIYKEGDQWKSTKSFGIEDLPKIAFAVTEIYKSLRVEIKDFVEDLDHESSNDLLGDDIEK